jgi:hypothetical protein
VGVVVPGTLLREVALGFGLGFVADGASGGPNGLMAAGICTFGGPP